MSWSSTTAKFCREWRLRPSVVAWTSALMPAHTTSLPAAAKPAWPRISKAVTSPPRRSSVTTRGERAGLGERDLFNPQLDDRLPVPVALADALLRLIMEDFDLGRLSRAEDGGGHARIRDQRAARQEVFAVEREQNPVEDDALLAVGRRAVQADDVALLDSQLSSVGLDDGEHRLLLNSSSRVLGNYSIRRRAGQTVPTIVALDYLCGTKFAESIYKAAQMA